MSIEAVQKVFDEIFGNNSIPLNPEITARDILGWDSFAHINLILALENAFKVTFTREEMSNMANVGSLVLILKDHECDVSWDSQ